MSFSSYLRMMIKRAVLSYRLKRICSENRYIFHPDHRGWIFDGLNGSAASFYVECPEKIYSVKLTGSVGRLRHINFIDSTHYSIRRFYGHFRGIVGGVSFWEDIGYQKEPYDFTYRFCEPYLGKEVIPVVLVCPVPTVVSAIRDNRRQVLSDGDFTGEGYLYSRRGFLALLHGIK